MRKRNREQIQKEYRNQLIRSAREVEDERRREIYHQHWQQFRDAHREARDFYRSFG